MELKRVKIIEKNYKYEGIIIITKDNTFEGLVKNNDIYSYIHGKCNDEEYIFEVFKPYNYPLFASKYSVKSIQNTSEFLGKCLINNAFESYDCKMHLTTIISEEDLKYKTIIELKNAINDWKNNIFRNSFTKVR